MKRGSIYYVSDLANIYNPYYDDFYYYMYDHMGYVNVEIWFEMLSKEEQQKYLFALINGDI